MDQPIVVSRDGATGVATVTLNRPDRMNAMSKPMWEGLVSTMNELSDDMTTRCVVLCGAGGNFAAGADISEFKTERASAKGAYMYDEIVRKALNAIRRCPHPVIAKINGACVGGGMLLTCVSDIRIAAESARFGVPISRLGMTMPYPEMKVLLDVVGPQRVREILLEGRVFGAVDAYDMGLVSRVVVDHGLEEEVNESAYRIAMAAPQVNRWHKAFIRRLADPRPINQTEMETCYKFLGTEDYREGVMSFLEKRAPKFTGK